MLGNPPHNKLLEASVLFLIKQSQSTQPMNWNTSHEWAIAEPLN